MWQDIVVQYLDPYLTTSDYTLTQWYRLCNIAAKESIDAGYSYADGYSMATTGNIENWDISPDPSEDIVFVSFVAHKVWCNIYRASLTDKAMDASMVQDGLSKIDTRNSLPSKNSNFETPCDIFDNMLLELDGDNNETLYNFATEDM